VYLLFELNDLLRPSLDLGILFSTLNFSACLLVGCSVEVLVSFGDLARRGERGNKGFLSKQGEFGALLDLKDLASGGGT
jgi:hypothetical protein